MCIIYVHDVLSHLQKYKQDSPEHLKSPWDTISAQTLYNLLRGLPADEKQCLIGEERLMAFSLLKSDRFWGPSNGATA